jgi:hypothetical protein
MNAAAAALLILTALPFPAPRVVEATDQMKCDWGTVASVDEKNSKLIVATAAGPVTFQTNPSVQVIGVDGKSLGSISALKSGQRVRVYYVVDHGAILSEVDVLEQSAQPRGQESN